MKHALSLLIPNTSNDWSFTIQDTSVYADLIPVSCPTLQILLPGFVKAVTFNDTTPIQLQPYFIFNFSACNLEVQTTNCGTVFNPLPDGIYVIKYSVSPNNIVFVEYNHLRITKALKKYDALLCELDLAPCDPTAEKEEKLKNLQQIRGYLEAAQVMVATCHKAERGMELYNYAMKRLDKLNCQTC